MTTQHSDILVIGGGVAGLGVAAFLDASASVTVLEAEDALGYHSSGRSAAVCIPGDVNLAVRALVDASMAFFRSPDGVSDRALISQRGRLLLVRPRDAGNIQTTLARLNDAERLSPDQAVELVPILRSNGLAFAVHDRSVQDIDVDRMLQGYARKAKRSGVKIHKSARVLAITRGDGTWRVVTENGEFQAPVLVNAAGAWADHVAQLAGVGKIGLRPLRRSAALIPAPDGHDISRWPLFEHVENKEFYAKPDAGRLMVSPADEGPVDPHDAWPDDMVLAEGLHRYEAAVTVPVTRIEHSWAGLRTFAPDRTPVVGFDPRAQGFFWLAGQGGDGMHTSPALSRLAASLITASPPTMADPVVTALTPARFLR